MDAVPNSNAVEKEGLQKSLRKLEGCGIKFRSFTSGYVHQLHVMSSTEPAAEHPTAIVVHDKPGKEALGSTFQIKVSMHCSNWLRCQYFILVSTGRGFYPRRHLFV